MSKRDAYVAKMKNQLDDWNAEVGKLENRIQTVSGEAQAKYQQQLDEAQAKQKEVEAKLDEIKGAGEDVWENTKDEMEHVWKAFTSSVNYFKSQFK